MKRLIDYKSMQVCIGFLIVALIFTTWQIQQMIKASVASAMLTADRGRFPVNPSNSRSLDVPNRRIVKILVIMEDGTELQWFPAWPARK